MVKIAAVSRGLLGLAYPRRCGPASQNRASHAEICETLTTWVYYTGVEALFSGVQLLSSGFAREARRWPMGTMVFAPTNLSLVASLPPQ